jgi:hypothetical protein
MRRYVQDGGGCKAEGEESTEGLFSIWRFDEVHKTLATVTMDKVKAGRIYGLYSSPNGDWKTLATVLLTLTLHFILYVMQCDLAGRAPQNLLNCEFAGGRIWPKRYKQ